MFRQGKFIEIQFNATGQPDGGKVSNFLLEKVRTFRIFNTFFLFLAEIFKICILLRYVVSVPNSSPVWCSKTFTRGTITYSTKCSMVVTRAKKASTHLIDCTNKLGDCTFPTIPCKSNTASSQR